MKKKLLLSVLILINIFTLTGCLKTVQLNERALVQAIGIDYEDGQFELTFQIFSPTTGGGTNIGATADNAKIIESKGRTISEAVQNATMVQGKEIFVGHNRIIIIGSDFAENGLEQTLSYFTTTALSRKNVNLAVADGKAKDILKAKINQGMLPAETLEKVLENTYQNGMIENIQLFEFVRAYQNKNESAILPIIKMKKDEEGSGGGEEEGKSGEKGKEESGGKKSEEIESVSSISIDGIAVISNGKMVGKLDKRLSRGVLWLRNTINKTSIETKAEKFDLAVVRVYKSNTKITPFLCENELKFKIEIECLATLEETKISDGVTVGTNDIRNVQVAAQQVIEKECNDAFEKAIKEYRADVFNLSNMICKDDIELYKKIRQNWDENVDKIEIEVSANVDIDRVGLEYKEKA